VTIIGEVVRDAEMEKKLTKEEKEMEEGDEVDCQWMDREIFSWRIFQPHVIKLIGEFFWQKVMIFVKIKERHRLNP